MKKRKKFKGMTLMEIIISLAVLAVLTLILVQTSNVINMYIRSANNVNKKTVQQAPVAEVGHKDAGELVQEDVVVKVSNAKFSQDLQGDAYRVNEPNTEIVEVEEGVTEVVVKDEIGGDLNMQYIVDLEAVTTTAPIPGT